MTDISRLVGMVLTVVLSFGAGAAHAQSTAGQGVPASGARDTAGPLLTLSDALNLARRSSPVLLQSMATARAARGSLRAAYGQLLPQASASLFGLYAQSGNTVVSGSLLGTSGDYLQSAYQLGLTYTLSASTLLTPGVGRAMANAAEADVAGQAEVLESAVSQQYVTVVEDEAKASLQDSLLVDVRAQLELTRARVSAGAATILDSARASVALGQQSVQALQAHNLVDIDKLRLFQQIGVPQPAGVRLVDSFPVALPPFTLDSVLTLARRTNPQVNASRAREHAANVAVGRALGLYAPTLQIATGVGGYTFQYTNNAFPLGAANAQLANQFGACAQLDTVGRAAGLPPRNCGESTLTPTQAAAVAAQNRQFPFRFQNIPRQISGTFTLPIFDGFQREQRVAQAEADRDTTRYGVRRRELQLTADVTSAYLILTTAVKTVEIQEQNAHAALQALAVAEERYRLGAATIVDVEDARAAFARADNDRISAVFDFHKAHAALESAIGRPLP